MPLSLVKLPTQLILSLYMFSLSTFAAVAAKVEPSEAEWVLTNNEGTLRFSLEQSARQITYSVEYVTGGTRTSVLEKSPLGLTRTDADFTEGLSFVAAGPVTVVEDNYTLRGSKVRKVSRRARERTFHFRNALEMPLNIVARAYEDGVAFRYELPGITSQPLYFSGEATGFKLPHTARVWMQPYSKVDVWAPGYEANYVNGVPAGTSAPGPSGWALPVLFQQGPVWALVTEAGLDSNYYAIHLEQHAPDGLYRVRLPEFDETYGVSPQQATATLPWSSPWRVVIVGPNPGTIVESTLVTDVALPSELKNDSWVEPGMASWSWWSDMSSPSDYSKLVPYVDVAAKFGWRYCLVDLGWHQMKGGNVKQLAEYAAAKNVGLILWYNSSGKHNQVPDAGPMNLMVDPTVRDAEMSRIAALGIKGIKVDFMQSDKQFVIGLYHDILRDAARHKLVVDFHGCTLPKGWERTHPNLISMEAVRGGEQYWDKTFAENAHLLNSIYVFTRNAVGPMDYTPGVFTDPGASNPGLQKHLTTNAHELALLVVFQSGIQHVIDPAGSLMTLPESVQNYLKDLPAAWDETRWIQGEPGKGAVLARRSKRTWYLSGINGTTEQQLLTLPLSFLGTGRWAMSLISDGATPRDFASTNKTIIAGTTLTVQLAPRGGFATEFTQP